MTAELATVASSLGDQMDFARAVVQRPEGGARSLLPEAYRDNPANVLLAVGLGAGMGLSPAESLYRIDVIQGKPCASAELIAANVRKAGHKLRVEIDDQAQSVTATIVRADDPDFPFSLTRDMAWARQMGLVGKDNYKKQPMTMLQWRAISGVARLACPEALYGVQYTPDEMQDMPRSEQSAGGGLAAVIQPGAEPDPEIHEAEVVESPLLNTRSALAKRMYATINEAGITDNERLPFISSVIGRTIESSKEMTDAEAEQVIDHLRDALEPETTQPARDGEGES